MGHLQKLEMEMELERVVKCGNGCQRQPRNHDYRTTMIINLLCITVTVVTAGLYKTQLRLNVHCLS